MIATIAHIAYVARDMQATLRFYCGQLGFEHAFTLPGDDGRPKAECVKIAEGQLLELFYARPDYDPKSGSYLHLCLAVDDVHKTAQALEESGMVLREKPQQGKSGNWRCWVDDPDGNAIEFMQINPSSPQARA